MRRFYFLLVFGFILCSCTAQKEKEPEISPVLPGAYQLKEYLPMLEGKKVGLFANHSSLIGDTHLVDTLLSKNVNIVKAYTPEHGFFGSKPDGEIIKNEQTSYPFELVALYDNSYKPTKEEMMGLDILIIDIQDVGARYYTYSSTMTYLMQACAMYNIPVLILDRPNPNGSYIDGPVMEKANQSFIGMHPIPIVHGLTLGELAMMINKEGWLGDGLQCQLSVIKIRNWDHSMRYSLPVKPSPNLPNDLSIALYPSLALFESTILSVGRGTDHPFQMIGHPQYPIKDFSFTPKPNEGSKYPPLEDELCYGQSYVGSTPAYAFTLKYLIHFYNQLKGKTKKPFFTSFFNRHAGTDELQKQIEAGWTEEKIRATWENDLKNYKELRKKYLLYLD